MSFSKQYYLFVKLTKYGTFLIIMFYLYSYFSNCFTVIYDYNLYFGTIEHMAYCNLQFFLYYKGSVAFINSNILPFQKFIVNNLNITIYKQINFFVQIYFAIYCNDSIIWIKYRIGYPYIYVIENIINKVIRVNN